MRVGAVAATFTVVINALVAQTLTWLGTSDNQASIARGVSADGTVVIGTTYSPYDEPFAYRWTAVGGIKFLGSLPGALAIMLLAVCRRMAW